MQILGKSHQVNAFCAAIQALKTGGIILADESWSGKNNQKLGWCSMFWTRQKKSTDFSSCYFEKMGSRAFGEVWTQAVILDRYTVEHDLANVRTHLENADEVSIVIASMIIHRN